MMLPELWKRQMEQSSKGMVKFYVLPMRKVFTDQVFREALNLAVLQQLLLRLRHLHNRFIFSALLVNLTSLA